MTENTVQTAINELYNRLDGVKNEIDRLTLDTKAYLDNFCDKDKTQMLSEYEEIEEIWRKCRNIQFSLLG